MMRHAFFPLCLLIATFGFLVAGLHSLPRSAAFAPQAAPAEKAPSGNATSRRTRPPAESRRPPREALFEGWPKPKLALVLTGEQLGYIEPCGCAGLENQKGGLRRRHTFLQTLAAKGWPVVALDNGGLISRFGVQTEIKYETTALGLKAMGYAAIGFGEADLKLPAGRLLSVAGSDPSQPPEAQANPFISANAGLFGLDSGFLHGYRVIEAGGMRLGVTAVIGDQAQRAINNPDIELAPAGKALTKVMPELKKSGCDYLVLLAHATVKESEDLAKKFPDFDVVVTAGGNDEPPNESQTVEGGKSLLVQVGHKGMYAIVLGLFEDAKHKVRYERVPLDDRFSDSSDMDRLLEDYQQQLEALGWSDLGIEALRHPRATSAKDIAGTFIGSKACADCHEDAFAIWEKTPHAHATETLAGLKPPRQFDPECISCHATGWNFQEFVPYQSGYESLKKTPLLAGNGCENCHGPGAAHVAAEEDAGTDEKARQSLREAMELSFDEARDKLCISCHDLDNDPNYKPEAFDEHYWPAIKH